MAQISIQLLSQVPSRSFNPFTGSRSFQEGFNVYQLQATERTPIGTLVEKNIIFRSSLDHKRFTLNGNLWSHTSLLGLIQSENSKSEFYKTHRQEQFLTAGVHSFSQEELDAANQVWSQLIA
jgi:hypothetical protein